MDKQSGLPTPNRWPPTAKTPPRADTTRTNTRSPHNAGQPTREELPTAKIGVSPVLMNSSRRAVTPDQQTYQREGETHGKEGKSGRFPVRRDAGRVSVMTMHLETPAIHAPAA